MYAVYFFSSSVFRFFFTFFFLCMSIFGSGSAVGCSASGGYHVITSFYLILTPSPLFNESLLIHPPPCLAQNELNYIQKSTFSKKTQDFCTLRTSLRYSNYSWVVGGVQQLIEIILRLYCEQTQRKGKFPIRQLTASLTVNEST